MQNKTRDNVSSNYCEVRSNYSTKQERLYEVGQFETFFVSLTLSESPGFAQRHKASRTRTVRKVPCIIGTFRIVRLHGTFRTARFRTVGHVFFIVRTIELSRFFKKKT